MNIQYNTANKIPARVSFQATPAESTEVQKAKTLENDTIEIKSSEDKVNQEQTRKNVEIHNAKVRASGYTALALGFAPLACIYYACKNPQKMTQQSRPDQQKESTSEKEIEKQKEIKRAQVKASLFTLLGLVGIPKLGVGGLAIPLLPFLAYKCVENPEKPSDIF